MNDAMTTAAVVRAINGLLDGTVADGGTDGSAAGSDVLTASTVEELARRYPYFTLPAAILLRDKGDLPADLRRSLSQQLARRATSTVVLNALLDEDESPFYPDEADKTPTTERAIDKFLMTYGNGGEDDEVLNRLIFNPTPDYAQLLAREESENLPEEPHAGESSHDDLLNRFILKQKQQEGSVPEEKPTHIPAATVENRHSEEGGAQGTDTSLLSESLAKIFIRQRQYERAFEIISQLSLKYPEKSVYFADQMRFLRKVINNRRRATGTK